MAKRTTAKQAGPRPRTEPKSPVRLCAGGHRQSSRWKRGDPCLTCKRAEQVQFDREAAIREREVWSMLNPSPAYLTMRVVDTGRLIVHAIPKHLMRRRPGRGRSAR